MIDSTIVTPQAAVPWYQSPVQKAQIVAAMSAFLALSPKAANLIGWKTSADVQVGMEAVFGFIGLVAPIVGSVWRARSKLQPLTLTKAGAAAHPATVAITTAAPVAPLVPSSPEEKKP